MIKKIFTITTTALFLMGCRGDLSGVYIPDMYKQGMAYEQVGQYVNAYAWYEITGKHWLSARANPTRPYYEYASVAEKYIFENTEYERKKAWWRDIIRSASMRQDDLKEKMSEQEIKQAENLANKCVWGDCKALGFTSK